MDLAVSHDDEARQQRLVGWGVAVDSDENLALIIGVQAGEDVLSQTPPKFTPCCQGLPPCGPLQQSGSSKLSGAEVSAGSSCRD
ncbi:hypothetical protein, partial [Streptomyces sp. C10-9-1]|uniref:hypothetical protein n=1 Tax=Streptomyces sp. C10-9-1 TaxID=1859285 RepID=UPI003D728081